MEWRAVIARAVPLFRYADLVRLQTNPVKEKLFRLRQRLQEHYNALEQESVENFFQINHFSQRQRYACIRNQISSLICLVSLSACSLCQN